MTKSVDYATPHATDPDNLLSLHKTATEASITGYYVCSSPVVDPFLSERNPTAPRDIVSVTVVNISSTRNQRGRHKHMATFHQKLMSDTQTTHPTLAFPRDYKV